MRRAWSAATQSCMLGRYPELLMGFSEWPKCCRGGVRAVPDHTAHTWRLSLGLCPLGSQLAEEGEVISLGPPPGPRRRSSIHCEAVGLPRGSSRMSQPHSAGKRRPLLTSLGTQGFTDKDEQWPWSMVRRQAWGAQVPEPGLHNPTSEPRPCSPNSLPLLFSTPHPSLHASILPESLNPRNFQA